MQYFEEAVDLVNYSSEQIVEIEQLFNKSLSKSELESRLLIKIKNLLENLRSALDYCAQGLCEKYGSGKNRNTYFPYASLDTSREQFLKRLDRNIPGLQKNRPDLAEFIESMQHFYKKGAEWYPQFMHLTNKNKHVRLTQSNKMDGVILKVGGLTIQARGITMGPEGRIKTEQGDILPGQEVLPGKPVKTSGDVPVTTEGWKTYFIEGLKTHMNALEFLKHSQQAIHSVVTSLSRA